MKDEGIPLETLFARVEGGAGRVLERIGLARSGHLRVFRVAVVLAVITWLPLLILSLVGRSGPPASGEISFLGDFLPYGQFLLTVPVLIVAEVMVGRRVGWMMAELRESDILAPAATPHLDVLARGAVRHWRGWRTNLVLLALTVVLSVASLLWTREWLTGSWQQNETGVTAAGMWYLVVSQPVMRFLVLRWCWRFVLWACVLARIARLEIQPQPVHPDRAGGLAFIGGAQSSFSWLVLALGIQLACVAADAITYRGMGFVEIRLQVLAYILGSLVILILPLLAFSPKMVFTRERRLIDLSGQLFVGGRELERSLQRMEGHGLPASDISGMADFSVLYENARRMRSVPMEPRHAIAMVAAAAAPFLPLVFLAVPAREVFGVLVKLLI